MISLRPYQSTINEGIDDALNAGHRNVLAVAPTGSGKTVIESHRIRENNGPAVAIAHRKELVGQISLALARNQIRHTIIGQENTIRLINKIHTEELGRSYYHPNATTAVASVDTLISWAKKPAIQRWGSTVTLWVQDECHHVLRDNKWGKATLLFPNARGIGFTATPCRADGKGLGRHADGLFDVMVEGPTQRQLINAGYLTDYRIYAPPSDLDMSQVPISSNGDWSQPGTKKAVRRSHIIGDVVREYLRVAAGKLGVTFSDSIENATDITASFNAAGVRAELVTGKTPDAERVATLRRFKNRELLQLVNVDLFGEGFDLPAIEVVSMARPTQSFALFVQQAGRSLRIMDGKQTATIIDHVGNVARHARVVSENGRLVIDLCNRVFTLDRQDRRSRQTPDDVIPIRTCLSCFQVYEAVKRACPFCGYVPVPAARSGPEFVDGDLFELDPEALARLYGDIARVDASVDQHLQDTGAGYLGPLISRANAKRHLEHQVAQAELRESIAWWAAYQRQAGRPDSESYRRFWFLFGTDVLTAQTLKPTEARELKLRVDRDVITG